VRYRDFEISVVQGIDQPLWKWTALLEGRRLLTGHASSKPRAIARAVRAIDQAVAPIQLIIEQRAAKLLREVRALPPGPERESFLAEIQQIISGFGSSIRMDLTSLISEQLAGGRQTRPQ
jgi:hypothetical protein